MVRKNRDLIKELKALGFTEMKGRGKGSHRQFRHKVHKITIRIAGGDGDDVHHYNEEQLEEAKQKLRERGA